MHMQLFELIGVDSSTEECRYGDDEKLKLNVEIKMPYITI
jgi:hypothetical protein